MSLFTVALIVFGLLFVQGIGLYFIFKRREAPVEEENGMLVLHQRLDELTRTMDQKLGQGTERMFESMNKQFDQSQRLMSDITNRVSLQMTEVTKGVTEASASTKQVLTIAEQLKNLEKVLTNQKQRGNLGERSLELILSNVLPGQYESQHEFKNGDKVDFLVKTPDGPLPVDAKFPLENYERFLNESDQQMKQIYQKEFRKDLKNKIDQTAKYIREEEGTLPYAFMYSPAEGIFSALSSDEEELGINVHDLIDYSQSKKKVYITSPATFLLFLQTVILGNKRMKFLEGVKDIEKNVAELSRHLRAYEASHNSLGKSLSAAVGHYESSGKAFRAIPKDVAKIASGEVIDLELESVDRPLLPEG